MINLKQTTLITLACLLVLHGLVSAEDCRYSGVHVTLGDNFASKKCKRDSNSNQKTSTYRETKTIATFEWGP